MRLLLASVVTAVLAVGAVPSSAGTAVDTTGTVYSTDRVVVAMTFPVAGPVSMSDTYLTCRSGCARKHMGQDLMGVKMTPLVATFNGTVSSLKRETSPGSGNYLVINGDNGWSAFYLHVNNDTPGTDDGRGTAQWAFPKGIEVGTRVMAGQLVAWRGDSGNAESTGPHLHFELRKGAGWGGTVYNAYPSLVAARRLSVPLPSGPHPDRSLLKSSTGAIFMTDGALKRPVSAGVLAANGLSAASALTPTAAEFLLYKTGPALALRDGALVSDPAGAAWRVLGRTRYGVTPVPGQHVVPVATADLAGLTEVDAPTGPTAGMLVRTEGRVYAVDADGVLHQVTSYTMASWGWSNADVVDLAAPEVPVDGVPVGSEPPVRPVVGDPLGLRDASLVNIGGVGAAVVSGGVVRRLWDAREIVAYGYTGKPRMNVPATLVTSLPVGEIAGPAYTANQRRR
jgi:hypothetical protein